MSSGFAAPSKPHDAVEKRKCGPSDLGIDTRCFGWTRVLPLKKAKKNAGGKKEGCGTYMKKKLGRELESGGKQCCEDGLACGAGIFKEASSDMRY